MQSNCTWSGGIIQHFGVSCPDQMFAFGIIGKSSLWCHHGCDKPCSSSSSIWKQDEWHNVYSRLQRVWMLSTKIKTSLWWVSRQHVRMSYTYGVLILGYEKAVKSRTVALTLALIDHTPWISCSPSTNGNRYTKGMTSLPQLPIADRDSQLQNQNYYTMNTPCSFIRSLAV